VPKQLMFDDNARAKLLKGVEKLAGAVAVTMGPTGRNVIIDKSYGGPTVTKDGVTVSKEVDLEDAFENAGRKGGRNQDRTLARMSVSRRILTSWPSTSMSLPEYLP